MAFQGEADLPKVMSHDQNPIHMTPQILHCIPYISVIAFLIVGGAFSIEASKSGHSLQAMGPLKVSQSNPRYFIDGNGKPVYLTGSHSWDNLTDWGDPTPNFDYIAYLRFLQANNHNFIRLWAHESTGLVTGAKSSTFPLPWQRSGPGMAYDGKPKFNLLEFNQEFFERLRERVLEARKREIYVSIMFFNRYFYWPTHPFNSINNVNGIHGDLNGDGDGREVHTFSVPDVTNLQKAYMRKVIDTVNDLDNILYEIGNEMRRDTIEWQYHMINFVHEYQQTLRKQHPVGMTSTGGGSEAITNLELLQSAADWISPRSEEDQDYSYNPPAADGNKVIVSDTDHLSGVLDNPTPQWVWKSFLRGLNPIVMDVIQNRIPGHTEKWNDPDRPSLSITRKAMGHTLKYAGRINLARMVPYPDLSSTKYCLTDPGAEYLIYVPSTGLMRGRGYRVIEWISHFSDEHKTFRKLFQFIGLNENVRVDLSSAPGMLNIEWFNPLSGEAIIAEKRNGGDIEEFTAPFPGDAVLYIHRN